jgi:vitamin B12 transporter
MKRPLLRFLDLLAAVLVSGFSLQAQNSSSDAHLFGTLLASGGAGVANVQVTAQLEAQTGAQFWKATSSTHGAYDLAMPPGRYRVTFQRRSFISRDFLIDLSAGEQYQLDLHLELEPLSPNVVVTAQAEPTPADRTTAPVSVISRDEIDEHQWVGVADALTFATGLAIGRTGPEGGTTSVFLNGGNSDFSKVLVDGAPINPPGNAVDFSSVTLDNIDKVEIVRGAESAIYGSDAVSGGIQLFTHRGETRVPKVSVYGEGGSFGAGRGGLQVSGVLGAFDYSVAGSYLEADGQGFNDRFLNRTLSGNFGYAISDTNHLRLAVRDNDSDAGTPGQTIFEPPSLYAKYKQHLFSSSATWNFSTGKHWQHQISGAESYTWQDSNNPLQSYYATDPNAFCPQTNPTAIATTEFCDFTGNSYYQYNRANVTAQTSFLLSDFGATGGYEYEVENAFLTSIGVPHARRNNQAGYLDFGYRPHARASLDFGARAEDNAYFGTRVVPRVGAALVLLYGKGWRGDTIFRGFYGEGIKEPGFEQIFGDNFGDYGNPALKPETSKTWTLGIDQRLFQDRLHVNINYFSSRFYDIVSFEFCSPDPVNPSGNNCGVVLPGNPTSFGYYFNTDLARARGLNLEGQAQLTHWLNAAGNYTYDNTLVISSPNSTDPTETAGNRLLRRPVNSGSLTLNGNYRRLNVTLGNYFTGVRTDSDFLGLGYTRNPGYARFDLSGSYYFDHGLTVYARATNLFDRHYQDALGYPALGRDMRIGIRYTFGGHD